MISIFEYSDHRKFLVDFAHEMKISKPTWSLGVWAMSLGLKGTASISRVLSGDRLPGDDLVKKLISYFEFPDEEANYFERLIHRERYYQTGNFPRKPAVVIRNAEAVSVYGTLDAASTTSYLRQFHLEPILTEGFAIGSLNVNFFHKSNWGNFVESHACIACRPIGHGVLDAGLFMGGYTSSGRTMAALLKLRWGFHYQYRNYHLERDRHSVTVAAGNDPSAFIKMSLNGREKVRIDDQYESVSYGLSQQGIHHIPFTIDSLGTTYAYDANLDKVDFSGWPEAAAILNSLNFKISRLTLHENMFSLILAPGSKRISSY